MGSKQEGTVAYNGKQILCHTLTRHYAGSLYFHRFFGGMNKKLVLPCD